ncbi:MAG TPA: DUF4082 domain-containing protein [Chloroflexota bacterium]|nr:DUF4082 domain-containing protein [Chloroflexota bacterium]
MTLYRHPTSRALVFGAGTIQYAWGLDDAHDRSPGPTSDANLRQATVNLLADMGVQPGSLPAGLVPATASIDALAPTSTVTAPSAGASVALGSTVTISGTAGDAGGGRVGGVQVSTDGGATWHPASGRENWSYTWVPSTSGSTTIRTRAVDDSGNDETPAAGTAVTVAGACPCSIWNKVLPADASPFDNGGPIELGLKFRPRVDGFVTGVRFHKSPNDTGGPHLGNLWDNATGQLLASATFADTSAPGWQEVRFSAPVPVRAGTTYVTSYNTRQYTATGAYFAKAVETELLRALAQGEEGGNGVFKAGSGFPTEAFNATNYWVDVLFTTTAPPDTTPPTITNLQVTNVTATGATVRWTTDEPADGEVRYGPTAAYGSAATETARAMSHALPLAGLTSGTLYHFQVLGRDAAGNATTTTADLTFRTSPPPSEVSLWDDGVVPLFPYNDPPLAVPIEVGVKVRSGVDGAFTGVRFYKGLLNTGVHEGHVWTAGGMRLATVTFTGESATGWQTARLSQPVPVTAGQVYVVSYTSPARAYAYTPEYFLTAHANGPLEALSSLESPNGVFGDNPGVFPTGSFNATNYWVDVLFTDRAVGGASGDSLPPRVLARSPAAGATDAGLAAVTASFDKLLDPAAIAFELRDAANAVVAGSVGYDAATGTATFTASRPLALGAAYTASVRATGQDGIPMAGPDTWSFRTGTCPCTLFGDGAPAPVSFIGAADPIELGVKFRSDVDGYVTGVRFYRGVNNAGPHTGRLWLLTSPTAGVLIATTTGSVDVAPPGWKMLLFPAPLTIKANAVYVASYSAPGGGYAYTQQFYAQSRRYGPIEAIANGGLFGGNGVFGGSGGFPFSSSEATNYWVDVAFVPQTAKASVKTATAPAGFEANWTFALKDANGNTLETVTTTGAGAVGFTTALGEGSYSVVETSQDGWRSDGGVGCSFSVALPGGANKEFACAFTNTFQPSIQLSQTGDGLSAIGDAVTDTVKLENTSQTGAAAGTPGLACTVSDATIGFSKQVTLGSGQSDTSRLPFTIPPNAADPFVNTATATCTYAGRSEVVASGSSTWSTNLFQPSIKLTKTGPAYSKVGETVTYRVTIENTSSADTPGMTLVSFADYRVPGVTPPAACDSLASSGSCSFTYAYVVPAADDSGQAGATLSNTAEAVYAPAGSPDRLTGASTWTLPLLHPSFTVGAGCEAQPVPQTGPATFAVTFANDGDAELVITADGGIGTFALAAGASRIFGVPVSGPFSGQPTVTSTVRATATLDPKYDLTSSYAKSVQASCGVGGRISVKKLTQGIVDPTKTWSFALHAGRHMSDTSSAFLGAPLATQTTFGVADGVLGFNDYNLDPTKAETLCELGVPAGWSVQWQVDTNGDGIADTIVSPYNPNAVDSPPQDLGNRCFDFGATTGYAVPAGGRLAFQVDNRAPGGEPRTIGFWKNWNSCTGGNQAQTAAKNGGRDAGWYILDDVLNSPGIKLAAHVLPAANATETFTVGGKTITRTGCQIAVASLNKQDKVSLANMAGDAAYALAAQLVAAKANTTAGAKSCAAQQQAILDADAVLASIGFTGTGNYLGSKVTGDPLTVRNRALQLANTIDQYNNGKLC